MPCQQHEQSVPSAHQNHSLKNVQMTTNNEHLLLQTVSLVEDSGDDQRAGRMDTDRPVVAHHKYNILFSFLLLSEHLMH